MISRSVYATDVRVRREAETLSAAGHRVLVIGLGPDQSHDSGVEVLGVGETSGLKRGSGTTSHALYRVARWVLLPSHREAARHQFEKLVRERVRSADFEPDVVHAHDFPALAVGTEIAENSSARLVYDSHELWHDMAHHGRPDPVGKGIRRRREGSLARSADAVITISANAAEVLATRYALDRVAVVRNTFDIRSDLAPPESPTGGVYTGRITVGRDLETVFTAWSHLTDLELHLMGPGDGTITAPGTAITHETSDLDTVERLLSRCGIGLVPLTRGPLNHDIALPNKLFEAIAVGIPVVAADLPALRATVVPHRIGRLYKSGDAASLATAVREVAESYDELVDAVRAAAPEFDWEVDARALLDVYEFHADKHGTGPTPI